MLCIAVVISSTFGWAQVNWVQIEDLEDSLSREQKPVYVFIHTSWCGYCKMMKHKVFADEKLQTRLNEDFYCVSINAETPDTLEYAGTKYPSELQSNGTYLNSLAKFLGEVNGKMSYPTNVFLSKQLVVEQQVAGYMRKGDFKYVLKTLTN